MGVSLKVTTPRWLRPTLPRLQTLFHQFAGDGQFPLLSPELQERAFRVAPDNQDARNRQAAVLVPLVFWLPNNNNNNNSMSQQPLQEPMPSLLLTKRSSKVTTHKSEISFPGGHAEEGMDDNLIETALREAQEECPSHHWDSTIVIGECTPVPSIRGTPVTSVLGILPEPVRSLEEEFGYNPEEVDEVFLVPLHHLLQHETFRPMGRLNSPGPVYPTKHGDIWGLSAFVIRPILHQLLKPVFLDNDSQQQQHELGTEESKPTTSKL